MIALNLDWIGMGELNVKGNEHWFAAHLDLVGANGVGLFYLAMRRGLDYLAEDANVDSSRIGVTGLSGGGWQTIVLSSLDPRVLVSIPVAGYTTLQGRVERFSGDSGIRDAGDGDAGDIEQNATDFLTGQDYSTLTAMRAPRPTLLIYNAEDDSCFRAPLVKPYVFDAIKPFFTLYGKENNFRFYQNTTISSHNYGMDNREQAYGFFSQHFHLQGSETEIPVGQYIRSYRELYVGVPKDNLTILTLAQKMATGISRPQVPSDLAGVAGWSTSQRTKLQDVVRYHPVTISRAWLESNTYHNQVESVSYRFELNNGLGATGVWLKDTTTKADAPMTIVLNDGGKAASATQDWDRVPEVADRMERGEQVVVLDLLFTGDASPEQGTQFFTEMLAATGERPLGLEAAQLIGIARWAQDKWNSRTIRVASTGIRSQIVSLVAAALEPQLFFEVVTYGGMRSLSYLLDKPVPYEAAPDLFCLDLYKYFDIDRLELLASPAHVIGHNYVELNPAQE